MNSLNDGIQSNDYLRKGDHNFSQAWAAMMVGATKQGVHYENDLTLTNCGVSVPFFNSVFINTDRPVTIADIETAKGFYSAAGKAFQFALRTPYAEQSADLLAHHGFQVERSMPGMFLPLDTWNTKAKPVSIDVVETTEDNLNHYFAIVSEAFEIPIWLTERLLNRPFIQQSNVILFLGYIDDEPACTSMLVVTGDVAGIYWVGTKASSRKRGLGEMITAHAVHEAARRGHSVAYLQASKMGAPIYQRMGFRTLCDYSMWVCES